LYYLSNGNPGEIKVLMKTKEKDVLNYYYINRVNDLNSLLDHIAHIKYLKENEEK